MHEYLDKMNLNKQFHNNPINKSENNNYNFYLFIK